MGGEPREGGGAKGERGEWVVGGWWVVGGQKVAKLRGKKRVEISGGAPPRNLSIRPLTNGFKVARLKTRYPLKCPAWWWGGGCA